MSAVITRSPPEARKATTQKNAPATSVQDVPVAATRDLMSNSQFDELSLTFAHAEAILDILLYLFGGSSSLEEPSKTDGVHGTVQHLNHVLAQANTTVMEINGDLPADLRWRTLEASHLIILLEEILFAEEFQMHMNARVYADYFSATLHAVQRARRALRSMAEV